MLMAREKWLGMVRVEWDGDVECRRGQ
jgi:hypothetical protein